MTQVAVVTGGNRGLGLEICRGLAKKGVLVILAARDSAKGLKAVEDFQKEELMVRFHPLDVNSASSIQALTTFLEKEFGRCDILVNNAGIFPDGGADTIPGRNTPVESLRKAMETNVYGALLLSQGVIPLMEKNGYGRIVNMSSGLGQLCEMNGNHLAYRMSKTAMNVLTRVLAAETKGTNILINSMCPGWCRTGMGGPEAPRTAAEGADTAVWLATLPDDGPTGGFFRDRKTIPW